MTRFAILIVVVSFCSNAAPTPLVTFESPCECRDNHGKHRWAEKNDPALPPTDASAIQAVTPSDIFNWQGPTEYLVPSSERIWSEQKWYALTGRVVDLRAEEDGDLHIAHHQPAPRSEPSQVEMERARVHLDGSLYAFSVSAKVSRVRQDSGLAARGRPVAYSWAVGR